MFNDPTDYVPDFPADEPLYPLPNHTDDEAAAEGFSSSSSLDTLETTEQPLPDADLPTPQTDAQLRLHSRHWDQRLHIIRSLDTSPDPKIQSRAIRLSQCRHSPIVWETDTGQVHIQQQACRDRLCPACQHQRAHKARDQVRAHLQRMDCPKFITFTINSTDETLAQQDQRLRAAWRAMRKQPLFGTRCHGGIYCIEATHNHTTGQWHTHLHIVADCNYIDQRSLSREWALASGGSPIVWIEAVNDAKKLAKYLADYIAKPADVLDWEPDVICEFAAAMHGKRMIHTFGTHHRAALNLAIDEMPTKPTRYVAPLRLAAEAAGQGDPRGEMALKIVRFGPITLQHAAGLHTDKTTPHCTELPPPLARRLLEMLDSLFSDYCRSIPFSPHATLPSNDTPPHSTAPAPASSNTGPKPPSPGSLFPPPVMR